MPLHMAHEQLYKLSGDRDYTGSFFQGMKQPGFTRKMHMYIYIFNSETPYSQPVGILVYFSSLLMSPTFFFKANFPMNFRGFPWPSL